MSATLAHKHICDDCIGAWEHADKACYRDYRKILTCDLCMAVKREKIRQKEVWGEMARNMPIPHDHFCTMGRHSWEHNDKKCALQEIIYLECEACMTFTSTHPCPKCGTESEEFTYGPYNVMRCVCPKCRNYFVPSRQEIYAAEAHLCPGCGKEAKKIPTTAPNSVHYICSDCNYSFYAEGRDLGATQEAAQFHNSACLRCGKGFIMKEDGLEVCPDCEYQLRSHNPSSTKGEDVCPQCGTHVVSDVCAECGYNILLDQQDNTDEHDAGVG